jgi:Secretion system C-terminal sorting domain/WD domain, G-beta repeat
MKKFILLFILITSSVFSQDNLTGKKVISVFENGSFKNKIIVNPEPFNGKQQLNPVENSIHPANPFNNTSIKWSYTEPTAIGDFCVTNENGNYNVVGWDLNSERISLYGNSNSTPIWEFSTDPMVFLNFVTISDTGGVVGAGSYHNVYLFDNSSNVPFFNYDLTGIHDTGIATSLDVTSNGQFLVCSASRSDSSTVFGFNSSSNIPVWSQRIVPTIPTGGAAIEGLKLSGNDSLFILNTYAEFFIYKTFTGQLIYRGLINPGTPNSGTQAAQGINGDGSIVATINYNGFINVYQWNGTTYNLIWQNQEPPGLYYNWYTAVDINYDGEYIAAGTLNFLTSSTFDGKIKVFKRSGNGTPLWTYTGCGDEVTALSFSKSGNILSASSWGEFSNTSEDLYIFKTYLGNVPIFKVNTPGSFFYCNTSESGTNVVASGKAVHARQFGNGGLMYDISVDTTDVPVVGIHSENSSLVSNYNLYQNYPNPFNPVTKIKFDIPSNMNSSVSDVKMTVYNLLGEEMETLVNENLSPGSYEVNFNGENLSSGVYLYKLEAGNYSRTMRMILLK